MSSLDPTHFVAQFLLLIGCALCMADGSYGFATFFGGAMILDLADEILKAIQANAAAAPAEGDRHGKDKH